MNVVLEGPDGGGKSTLAEFLIHHVPTLRLQVGDGPPKTTREVNDRARRYLSMFGTLFDRHPCVSQPIYDTLRGSNQPIEQTLVDRFYSTDHLIIYCRGDISRHVVKPGEDPDHIEVLTAKYSTLCALYDRWALNRAHVLFRIDNPETRSVVLDAVRSSL